MTHDVAQHIHESDPPLGKSPLFSPWSNPALVARMAELWTDHAASQIAKKLSAEFNVKLTRNSIVGRAFRMGLTANDKSEGGKRAMRPSRPKLKIVTNGSGLTLLESIESGVPKLRVVPGEPLGLSLYELTDATCRYPLGDGRPDWIFCGHTPFGKKPYCLAHCQISYLPPTERNARSRGFR